MRRPATTEDNELKLFRRLLIAFIPSGINPDAIERGLRLELLLLGSIDRSPYLSVL
ncbi:MAG: hypothetical protein ACO1PI_02615 [Bacteroidota bacterium]